MKLATTKDGSLRRFFAVPKVAEALDVHEDTILRMIHRKEITAVRWKGRLLRIPEDELERIMQRQREGREFKPETVSQFIPDQEAPQKHTMTTPFHKFRPKLVGDRVKIPRFPTDESRGYYHGTVVFGRITPFGTYNPGGNSLIVEWDEPVPYLGRYSDTIVAISEAPDPDPLWDMLENWKAGYQFA